MDFALVIKEEENSSLTILGPDGAPASSQEESAKFLFDHWAGVFSPRPVKLNIARLVLEPFIQLAPDDIDWDPTFQVFYAALVLRKDTGAGPDGIPYSFWSLAPLELSKAIFDNYLALKRGDPPTVSFNDSKKVCPAKGLEAEDHTFRFTRAPSKTRPLSLSNTDNKATSAMAALPMNKCASSTVSEIQAGGVRGRKMTDNILNLEYKALQFMITNQLLSGIFALDQAAAFPSISRAFILWVLKCMRIPRRIRKLIKALYNGGSNGISFGGRTFFHFLASAGVKQGDPSSMVIFVLCFDPILRWINSLLGPLGDHIFGYCDDVGIASQNMLRSWPVIKNCFHIVGVISGLFLNVAKTQCCVIFGECLEHIAAEPGEADPSLLRYLFKDYVKYLGVVIGPGAEKVIWSAAIIAYKECITFLRSIDAGFTSTISLYNVLGASIASWIGSFVRPSDELLILEGKSLQRLTHGPWNVFPKRLLLFQ